jgi:hypothetical protein
MRRVLAVTAVAVTVALGGSGLAGAAAATAVSPWTVQRTPLLPKEGGGILAGVSCAGAGQCIAVGTPPAEVWNGTAWVPHRITAGGDQASAEAVSCWARASCVAVGTLWPSRTSVAMSWNGTTWTIMPGSQLAFGVGTLAGISCVSVSDCVAVGSGGDGTVTMSWNGSTWAVDPTPTQTAEDDQLTAVSCASAASCLAIGTTNRVNGLLVEEWDGSVWTVLPNPPAPAGAADSYLTAVSCASAAECMVVGGYEGGGNGLLAELWNGSAWVLQAVPSHKIGDLWGVSCPAVGHCTAVGQTGVTAVVEAWNGARWNQQRGVTPPAGAKELYRLQAISCTAPHTCEAVGLIIPRAGSGHRYATPLAAGE